MFKEMSLEEKRNYFEKETTFIEQLEETGSVCVREYDGNIAELIDALEEIGQDVYYDQSTDCLITY